jgi:hypothetical protein
MRNALISMTKWSSTMTNQTKQITPNADLVGEVLDEHPVGAGVGAVVGGSIGGALAGTVAGVGGAVAGAAAGAVLGAWVGKAAAESSAPEPALAGPDTEEAYWRENYTKLPYVGEGSFEDYGPAFRYGINAYRSFPERSFDAMEPELSRHWPQSSEGSTLGWNQARRAARDAWMRLADSDQRVANS